MSDSSPATPRPVGLVTLLAIFACFAVFLLILDYTYLHHQTQAPMPFNVVAQNLGKADQWIDNPDARMAYLQQLRAKQNAELQSYGWVDQKAGVVQIPIDRAMQLVVQQYAKDSSK